ncbi:MAG: hypothetical protein ACXVA9_01730 [Bdellovibrionales bacterium]
MRKIFFFTVFSFLIGSQAGSVQVLCNGIFPKNNLHIPVSEIHASNMSQSDFDTVLDRLQKIYDPIIAAKGGIFKIERAWTDDTVNAYADRSGKTWLIHMYGGMARHPKLTGDGFALVACHELGHHLGGAPQFQGNWASIEGEADYYATLKCARRLFENDDNGKILASMTVDKDVIAACAQEFGGKQDQEICQRSAMAALSLGAVAADLGGNPVPQFNTPDTTVVKSTDPDHPQAQCRLDTYYNGATCKVPYSQELSDTDYHQGACADTATFAHGNRPLCWFMP